MKKMLASALMEICNVINRYFALIPLKFMFRLVEIKHGLKKGEITKRADFLDAGITHIEDDEDARKLIHEELMKG